MNFSIRTQDCRQSIQRLEDMIAVQEDRAKRMRHQPVGSLSHTRWLQACMDDSLFQSKQTLRQVRNSVKCLEFAWAMLDATSEGTSLWLEGQGAQSFDATSNR